MTHITKMDWNNNLPIIQNTLNELRDTTSKTKKEEILKNILESQNETLIESFKLILSATYSPREIFYIKPIKNIEISNTNSSNISDLTLLDVLNLFKSYVRGNKAINLYTDFKSNCIQNNNQFESELLDLVLDKDLKAGIAVNTINKVFPNLIPEQPYMRCSLISKITDPQKWLSEDTVIYSQEKMDGMFVNFTVNDDHSVEIVTRTGNQFSHSIAFEPLISLAKQLDNATQYHGELLVMDKNTREYLPREIGNGILNSLLKDSKKGTLFDENQHELQFVTWDAITLEQLNNPNDTGLPYSERFNKISHLINQMRNENNIIKLVDTKICYSIDEATQDFRDKLLANKEGVCWKLDSMLWKDTTNKDIIKLKNEFVVDLQIVDFIEGKGKNEQYFGSIKTQSSDGKLIVDVSGFTDKERQEIAENKENYLGKIMAVKASYITKTNETTYSLFLPRFMEFREDKTIADNLTQIREQYVESLSQFNPAEELRAKLEEKNNKKKQKKEKDLDDENKIEKRKMKI